MTDLHETNDLKYTAQIDTVGWIFVAFAMWMSALPLKADILWALCGSHPFKGTHAE
jgi:hypothetical protein